MHSLIGLPIVLTEDGPVGHGVEERPEGGVAAPIVVQVVLVAAQVHREHLDGGNFDPACFPYSIHLAVGKSDRLPTLEFVSQ